jgi:hypothetical protein
MVTIVALSMEAPVLLAAIHFHTSLIFVSDIGTYKRSAPYKTNC